MGQLRDAIALSLLGVAEQQVGCDHFNERETALLREEGGQRCFAGVLLPLEQHAHQRGLVGRRNLVDEEPAFVHQVAVRLTVVQHPEAARVLEDIALAAERWLHLLQRPFEIQLRHHYVLHVGCRHALPRLHEIQIHLPVQGVRTCTFDKPLDLSPLRSNHRFSASVLAVEP
jgi:hypothetical protein